MINVLNLVAVFSMFAAVTLLFYQLFQFSTEESMVMAASIIMLGVFFAGLLGNAKYSFFLFILMAIGGVLFFVLNISVCAKWKIGIKERLIHFVTPGFVCLCFFFLYAVVAFKGALYTYPDEIAQWGPAVRYMVQTGHLPYGEGFSGESVTLSMATMFQYIWSAFVPFSEKNTLIGNFLLAMIPIYLPLCGTGWKRWREIVIYSLIVFMTFNAMSYVKYYNLLQDHVLPIWAGSIIAWLIMRKEVKINWWVFLLAFACISPMKSLVGPLFAGIIVAVLLIRQLVLYWPVRWKSFINRHFIIYSVLVLMGGLLINQIWSIIVKQSVYNRFVAYDSQKKDIVAIIKGVINATLQVISSPGKALPFFSFLILCAASIAIVFVVSGRFKESGRWKVITIVFALYSIGFMVYVLIMIAAYAVIFGVSDSQVLGGLDRYYSYYMLLGCVPMVSLLFIEDGIENRLHLDVAAAIVFMFMAFGANTDFWSKVSTLNLHTVPEYQERLDVKEWVNSIKKFTKRDEKIFVFGTFSQNNSKVLGYELQDSYDWRSDCYAMYYRSDKKDLQTIQDIIRYPELLKLGNYKYLWRYPGGDYNIDEENLLYQYGLPQMEQGSFYKINVVNGEIDLEYVEDVK